MSTGSTESNATATNDGPHALHRPRRRLRNLLLDPSFQFKYAALLVAAGFLVMSALAPLILHYADATASHATRALGESRTNAELVQTSVIQGAGDNTELVSAVETRLRDLRQHTEAELARVEQGRARVRVALLAAALVLALVLGGVGIVVTHRVVGPAYKMQRLFARVATGKLDVHEALRRGDELKALFESFQSSIGSLRALREEELASLDRAIASLEREGGQHEAREQLRALRTRMHAALGEAQSDTAKGDAP